MKVTSHLAAPSMIGYLFQVRVALLESLRRLKNGEAFHVSVERFDDVAFDNGPDPVSQLQTKHHLAKGGTLGNMSPDLWGTLRVWCDQEYKNALPSGTLLYLLTTSAAPADSVAALLRQGTDRVNNLARVVSLLTEISANKGSNKNREAYAAFQRLTPEKREKLLDRVIVIDNYPTFADVSKSLQKELCFVVPPENLAEAIEGLEGWWFKQMVNALQQGACSIAHTEVLDRLNAVREGYKKDPFSVPAELSEREQAVEVESYQTFPFIKQLMLVGAGPEAKKNASKAYFLASNLRIHWIENLSLKPGDLTRYDNTLTEVWNERWALTRDESASLSETEQVKMGYELYKAIVQIPPRTVRDAHPSSNRIFRGSFHILANEYPVGSPRVPRIGWHPFYEKHIKEDTE